ncbi:MAG: hypothetical protein IKU62_03175 [Ruminiclostridium sp.]|nr:hypothetical protein [Ruminiclostridium sp.]
MKNSQNLTLYFAAIFALLIVYVVCVAQLPSGVGVFDGAMAGLAVCALVQAGSDLMKNRKHKN